MAKNSKHFRLGLFVITGALLLLGVVVLFGAGTLLLETHPAESYFDESVEGLEVGAPVKYRGVQVGTVDHIGFITERYPDIPNDYRHYVLVEMKLHRELAPGLSTRAMAESLEPLIERGLRIRLTTQGLTGVAYLEMDFVSPELNPTLKKPWEPDTLYVPSAPSTMSRVEAALDTISRAMKAFEKMDFDKVISALEALLGGLDQALRDGGAEDFGRVLSETVVAARDVLRNMANLLGDPAAKTIVPDASASLATLRSMLEENEDDLKATMTSLGKASASLERTSESVGRLVRDPDLQKSVDKLPVALEDLTSAAAELRTSSSRLSRLLGTLDSLTAGQRANIEAILQTARKVLDNMDEFLEDAQRNPSRIFFSEPPQSVAPGD